MGFQSVSSELLGTPSALDIIDTPGFVLTVDDPGELTADIRSRRDG